MKYFLPIAMLWLLGGCFAFGQYSSTQTTNENSSKGPSTRELDPNDWNGEVGDDGKIPVLGHVIETGKEFLQVLVWDNKLRVYFLNEDEEVIEPKVDLVTARVDLLRDDDIFMRLRPKGEYLEGIDFLRPPFIFRPLILRIQKGDDDEDDVYSFGFSQDYID